MQQDPDPTRTTRRDPEAGFTIIELGIVVSIIAFLLTLAFVGVAMLQASRVQDVVSLSQDLSIALRSFKSQYHLYPGDMTINAASPQIPGVNAACMTGGANVGNSDGVIQAVESPCVPEMLFDSGLFGKVDRDPVTGLAIFNTYFGNPTVVSASTLLPGIAMPPSVQNVLLFTNLPCATALEIDSKVDDGNLATGRTMASVANCVPAGLNDPVPSFAIGL